MQMYLYNHYMTGKPVTASGKVQSPTASAVLSGMFVAETQWAFIGLVFGGKVYRRPCFFTMKIGVSCFFSLKPIQ